MFGESHPDSTGTVRKADIYLQSWFSNLAVPENQLGNFEKSHAQATLQTS